jgi:thioredoxin
MHLLPKEINRKTKGNNMSVTAVTGKNFDSFIDKKGMVVIDFWAPWCAPCKAMMPIVEKAASSSFSGKVSFGKVDIDEEGALAGKCEVSSLPHFAVYRDGVLVGALQGALPPGKFHEFLEGHCT